jgi:hypothetical protein
MKLRASRVDVLFPGTLSNSSSIRSDLLSDISEWCDEVMSKYSGGVSIEYVITEGRLYRYSYSVVGPSAWTVQWSGQVLLLWYDR